ncbi:MAG: type VI secretion system-associated FHA domain protein TagH [Burkholderiales bacterium]|nr:type VI secretion system-associated FHA domain protein TagH [Burkholderiales bacterium]
MTIALRLYRKGPENVLFLGERTFEALRLTIGRGAECTLALDDPKKWVSRTHAELAFEGDALWLTVLSKVNPVFVNGHRHGSGSRLQVQAGDRLEIGEYELELLAFPIPAETAAPLPADADDASCGPQDESFVAEADIGSSQAEITAPGTEEAVPPAEISERRSPLVERVDATGSAATPDVPPVTSEERIFAEATGVGVAMPGEIFDEPTFVGKGTLAAQAVISVEDSVLLEVTQLRGQLPLPERGIFDEAPADGTSAGPLATDEGEAAALEAASERAAFVEPGTEQSELAAEGPRFAEPTLIGISSPASALDGLQRAARAFLEGAGLPERSFGDEREIEMFLRQSGAIVRAAVEGVMALLAARAEAKKEFRAEDRTMVASRDNNPLKLMSDPREAIDFLLDTQEGTSGFLPPVQAVTDAFDDVRAHEAALVAGMRAAVLGALRRFDPKRLEEELAKASGGLGLNRKARLWDLFSAYQQKLAREAEDDFNKAFGRDFIAAYMAQTKQLRRK